MVAKASAVENCLSRKLSECDFRFSKRMQGMFAGLELATIGDMTAIPLERYPCFRGFKSQCIRELIDFIEAEKLEGYFEGFDQWKMFDTNAIGAKIIFWTFPQP